MRRKAEVTNVDRFGIWVLVDGRGYFLPYGKYPWFRDATIREVTNVEFLHSRHLRWPDLDVYLAVRSLERPEEYPLIARPPTPARRRRREGELSPT